MENLKERRTVYIANAVLNVVTEVLETLSDARSLSQLQVGKFGQSARLAVEPRDSRASLDLTIAEALGSTSRDSAADRYFHDPPVSPWADFHTRATAQAMHLVPSMASRMH